MNNTTKPIGFDFSKPHNGNTWQNVGFSPANWDTFTGKDWKGRRQFTRAQVVPRFSSKPVMDAMLAEYNARIVANEARKAETKTFTPEAPAAKAPAIDNGWLARHDADLAKMVADTTAKALMAALQQQGRLV